MELGRIGLRTRIQRMQDRPLHIVSLSNGLAWLSQDGLTLKSYYPPRGYPATRALFGGHK